MLILLAYLCCRREADRPVAALSGDECRRRRRVHRQRLVARRVPSTALNVIWMAIGGFALWRIWTRQTIVDLSHVITEGMVTYKGLPGPHICDFWTREQSAANYDDGSTFQIGRIDMVANTGTYLDVPSHRFAEGADLCEVELEFACRPSRRSWSGIRGRPG